MFKKFSDYLLHLFQAPPGKRMERDIHVILPVFMMKIPCMKQLPKETVAQILQQSYLIACKDGDVIVRQGEQGDEFFIILKGSVSIYLDAKHDERGLPTEKNPFFPLPPPRRTSVATEPGSHESQGHPSAGSREYSSTGRRESFAGGHVSGHRREKRHSVIPKRDDRKNRNKYGTWVNSLGQFQSFGELALLYPNRKRNATSIADDGTILMVVSQDMFEVTLQDALESDLEEKRVFIQTHPFFSKWNTQMQRQLQWSLVRSTHKIGDHVIKQGDKVTGLHFLVSGRARLVAEPVRHRILFPEFFEKPKVSPFDTPPTFAREECTISEIAENIRLTKSRKSILAGMDPMTFIRRTDGYAAAEKIVNDKQADLCIIEEGEVVCDFELLLSLDKNVFGVVCATDCTFFHLDSKIFDRLIFKKSPHTLNMMKLLAETKLSRRLSSKQGERMTVLAPLLCRILDIRVVDPSADEKHGNSSSKQTSKTVMLTKTPVMPKRDHSKTVLVDWYMQGKTPLLQPITKDAIYYREMIQQRARVRETQRERGPRERKQVKSLARRIKDTYWVNMKEAKRAKNTMRRLQLQNSELTPASRWK